MEMKPQETALQLPSPGLLSRKIFRQAFRAPAPPSPGKYKYINIGSRQDKLNPTVLEKLPPSAANAAASIHKYWTSAFGEVAENAELTELLKLAEMYTSRSHVLKCELYTVLEMKVDELRSVIGGMRMSKRCAPKTKIFRKVPKAKSPTRVIDPLIRQVVNRGMCTSGRDLKKRANRPTPKTDPHNISVKICPHTEIEPALSEDFSPHHLRLYQLVYDPGGTLLSFLENINVVDF
ncbi:Uncharacterized protein Fot_13477 [Forsythia ovata]|uniref:Uncharacterized protein n=1 Tax=Forsythia ovata TaxID=205694 RepID=A0ABD1W3J7_9LAMI